MDIILGGIVPMYEPCGQCDRDCVVVTCPSYIPNRSCSGVFTRG